MQVSLVIYLDILVCIKASQLLIYPSPHFSFNNHKIVFCVTTDEIEMEIS